MLSSYALHWTFLPKKASQKIGAEPKMALGPTFSLYEIDPRSQRASKISPNLKNLLNWKRRLLKLKKIKNWFLAMNEKLKLISKEKKLALKSIKTSNVFMGIFSH